MPFGAAFAGAAALGLVGGVLQSGAAKSAASTQANAANNATQSQMAMFNTINNQNAPYRTASNAGLSKLSDLLGIGKQTYGPSTPYSGSTPLTRDQFDPKAYLDAYSDVATNTLQAGDPYTAYMNEGRVVGSYRPAFQLNTIPPDGGAPTNSNAQGGFGSLLHQFDANDLNSNIAPGYGFQLEQGLGATQNFLNKTGGLVSGNTLRGINDYAQGTAQNAYQNAFNNYTTNQSNIFNRLSSIAGLGQQANATTANAGTAISGNAANSMMNAGASQAAGQIGSANALAGGLGNAGSWYALSQFMPKQPNTNTDYPG